MPAHPVHQHERPSIDLPREALPLSELVRSVMFGYHGGQTGRGGPQRRRRLRVPFPYPICVTPVNVDGHADPQNSFTVIGRHLSECGLDFYHTQPVTQRKLIVSLEDFNPELRRVVMELTWCRFLRHGWYCNGGRFVSIEPGSNPYDAQMSTNN